MLTAGEKSERISFERDETTYERGVPTKRAVTYAKVWAKQRPLRGSEQWSNQRVQSAVMNVFEVDFRLDVNPKDRVAWSGQRMEIVDVQQDRAAWITTVYCKVMNG